MDVEAIAVATSHAIGWYLRDVRDDKELSRAKLAQMTNGLISAKTIQRFEEGDRSANFTQLSYVLAALEIPLEKFVEDALTKYPPVEQVTPRAE